MPTVLTWCFVWFLHSLWVWLVRRMFGKYLIVLFSFYHDSFLHLTLSFGNVPQIVIFKSQTLSKIPLILFLSPTQHHSSSVSPCSVTGGPVLFSSLSIFGPIFSSLSVSSLSQCFSHFPVLQIISECVKYPPGEADAVSLSQQGSISQAPAASCLHMGHSCIWGLAWSSVSTHFELGSLEYGRGRTFFTGKHPKLAVSHHVHCESQRLFLCLLTLLEVLCFSSQDTHFSSALSPLL